MTLLLLIESTKYSIQPRLDPRSPLYENLDGQNDEFVLKNYMMLIFHFLLHSIIIIKSFVGHTWFNKKEPSTKLNIQN